MFFLPLTQRQQQRLIAIVVRKQIRSEMYGETLNFYFVWYRLRKYARYKLSLDDFPSCIDDFQVANSRIYFCSLQRTTRILFYRKNVPKVYNTVDWLHVRVLSSRNIFRLVSTSWCRQITTFIRREKSARWKVAREEGAKNTKEWAQRAVQKCLGSRETLVSNLRDKNIS